MEKNIFNYIERLMDYGLDLKRAESFASKLQPNSNGCIEWKGHRQKQGYGTFKLYGKSELAHRVVAKVFHGESKKPCVCHTCDNPPCVNPDHLFWGTHSDNMIDMYKKKRATNSKGTKNYFNKLSEGKVNMVRFLTTTSLRPQQIADIFNVSLTTIYQIKNRKTWNHLKYVRPFDRYTNTRLRKHIGRVV